MKALTIVGLVRGFLRRGMREDHVTITWIYPEIGSKSPEAIESRRGFGFIGAGFLHECAGNT